MDKLETRAFAKLNLTLDVLGRLSNGYHEMRMVMQSVGLWDEVSLELTGNGEITARSNFSFLPGDGRNIAVKAAAAFFDAAGMDGAGVRIALHKRIPVGAGMGGGSSDAAAVLRGLNTLCGTGFSPEKLMELGGTLGSDVPFCVCGGTRLATGRGELLEPLPPMPDCGIVICKPAFSIRTPELFERIDSRNSRIRPDTEGMAAALREGDLPGIAHRMFNVFEDVLPQRYGEIAHLKQALLDLGALGAVMTGTGSAVFGLFLDLEEAERAKAALGETCRECFAAAPLPGVE
ncbi:MAG: 4-(cytidine 5'-diphospho)-2-C-methyl-D-erythritol kinase [Oscillospiraceae bacterium]|nr:4-(cytidine 5'-diphospho)-2-C-methyl-D-erythritol kinase [Oscillospiraceae bacterium]